MVKLRAEGFHAQIRHAEPAACGRKIQRYDSFLRHPYLGKFIALEGTWIGILVSQDWYWAQQATYAWISQDGVMFRACRRHSFNCLPKPSTYYSLCLHLRLYLLDLCVAFARVWQVYRRFWNRHSKSDLHIRARRGYRCCIRLQTRIHGVAMGSDAARHHLRRHPQCLAPLSCWDDRYHGANQETSNDSEQIIGQWQCLMYG